jgi:hypothetical protein
MTGMGNDGARTMAALRAAGGRTIAESEETAVVWGMPGELVKAGGADHVLPSTRSPRQIVELVAADDFAGRASRKRASERRRPAAPLRVPVSPDRHAVRRDQALLHRAPAADRLSATGRPTSRSISALRADPEERERLINAFTVNETYFYREEHQLACLSRSLLPDLITTRRPGDKIRIWSAPCSTGEEAYSIAIWLLENWRMVDAYNVEIIGSDIDTRVLEAAHDGLYGERALSRLPPDVIEAYFEPAHRHRRRSSATCASR